jgi:ABC-type nitrate/sulfonate/bicarbonate transport system permease component
LKKKLQSIINKLYFLSTLGGIFLIWQFLSYSSIIPPFLLPSPAKVIQALILDFPLLMEHSKITLIEGLLGLFIGIAIGFCTAVFMDHFHKLYQAFYPIIIITQTIPTIAIAPLLVLWLGYGIAPKITLIVIVTFFPIAVGLLEGFQSADGDTLNLLRSMGANHVQIFWHVKFPGALGRFFAGLKISVSYSIVGAVISEWLGGYGGLGVYMTRVRKSYAFDKMFAVIFLISALSLLLMYGVKKLEKICMPWNA